MQENIDRSIDGDHAAVDSANLRAFFDHSTDFFWVLDGRGAIVDVNQTVIDRLGRSIDELRGRSVLEVHPVDVREEAARIVGDMLAGTTDSCPLPLMSAAGEIIEVETRLVSDGRWNGEQAIFAVSRDVSKRRVVERALEESERRLERALAGAGLGTWDWNVQTGETVFNERWCRMLGYEPQEIDGHVSSWERLVHPEDLPLCARALEAHFSGQAPEYEMVHRMRSKSGEWVWVLDRGAVTTWDGEGAALLMSGTHLDVTEKHEAQLALEKRDRLLHGLNLASGHLLSGRKVCNEDIQAALEALGRAAQVDRVYIFEHEPGEPGERGYCSQRFEWSVDSVDPQIDNPELQNVPWDMVASRWYDEFLLGGYIAGNVADFPQDERDALEPQDIVSLLALPIESAEGLWGFIGFDVCSGVREWEAIEVDLLGATARSLRFAIERKRLAEALERTAEENRILAAKAVEDGRARLEKMVLDVVESMGRVVETRDQHTQGHQRRTAILAHMIALELGLDHLMVEAIQMAALVHDIGKLAVPVEILTKKAELTKLEEELVHEHPQAGFEILKGIDFPGPVAHIVLQHHEHYDGSGYPSGLRGDEILVGACVLRVADVLETLVSYRPCRPAVPMRVAVESLRMSKIQYHPQVVEAVLRLYDAGLLSQFESEWASVVHA